jgi:esterase/lipase superfamily enzyme
MGEGGWGSGGAGECRIEGLAFRHTFSPPALGTRLGYSASPFVHHEFAHWYSPNLQREMALEVFGHGGARVLVFPTSMGTHAEWRDRAMHEVLRDHLDQGWAQLFCVDQPHHENWGNDAVPPGHRAWIHRLYDRYLFEEVLPFIESRNGTPFLIATGASLGAYHASCFGLRYPERVHRIVSMSGMFDVKRMTGGYSDEHVYALNPMDFMRHEYDGARLAAFRRQDLVIAVGRGDPMFASTCEFSGILWSKGIGNALRIWDGHAHDWPVWEKMIRLYLGGHD